MNIYSTLQANDYVDPKTRKSIAIIQPGNNTVTDKTLNELKKNATFNKHLDGGYLAIAKNANDAESKAEKEAVEKAEREANEKAAAETKRLEDEATENKRLADKAEEDRLAEDEKKAADAKAQKELDEANKIAAGATGGKK
jgi:hypothetical protein